MDKNYGSGRCRPFVVTGASLFFVFGTVMSGLTAVMLLFPGSPIGRPIRVRQSWASTAFRASPAKLIARMITAAQYPHRFCRRRPRAAVQHPTHTTIINRTAAAPIEANPSCARGFNRQSGSIGLTLILLLRQRRASFA